MNSSPSPDPYKEHRRSYMFLFLFEVLFLLLLTGYKITIEIPIISIEIPQESNIAMSRILSLILTVVMVLVIYVLLNLVSFIYNDLRFRITQAKDNEDHLNVDLTKEIINHHPLRVSYVVYYIKEIFPYIASAVLGIFLIYKNFNLILAFLPKNILK